MSETPVIGISVSLDHGRIIKRDHDYLYIKRAYSKAVSKAGGHPVLLTPDLAVEAVSRICNAVIISGGDDIAPELYGEQASSQINPESAERIEWERRLLDLFSGREKPVLGVCYGMQLINVHFGGSLYQDISDAFDNPLDHGGMGKATTHALRINQGSSLFPVLGSEATVCSTHHQAIKRVAPGFSVAATSEDEIIEAIERENILAVEWHPEADATGEQIYSLLVERAKRFRQA